MIPFGKINPIKKEDFDHLLVIVKMLTKNLLKSVTQEESYGCRFMTDKEKPVIVNNNFSLKL